MAGLRSPTQGEEEEAGLTEFMADAPTTVIRNLPPYSDDLMVHKQSLPDFMERPVLLTTAAWTTASAANTVLYSWSSDNVWTLTGWTDKLKGFNMIRGNLKFKIVFNANPFQQGKLLLHFLPQVVGRTAAGDTAYVPMHNYNLVTKSQQPHVIIDVKDEGASMVMPYISPTNWYSRTYGYDWGTFYISVLSPLATGAAGQTEIQYSVYAILDDLELAAPIVPQSSMKPRKKFSTKIGVVDKEEKGVNDSLSSKLKSVAKVADSFKSVPCVSEIAGTVSWASNMASSAASWFGWSKPAHVGTPDVVARQSDRFAACADGVETAMPMGFMMDRKLAVLDNISVTDSDEMAWNFLKKVETFISSTSWTTATATNTTLLTIQVNPIYTGVNSTQTYNAKVCALQTGGPLYYFGQKFSCWRGSIVYKFRLVKTAYHTGRLEVNFTPINASAPTLPSTTTSMYNYRTIIDLRETNEFEIVCPYLIDSHYLYTTTDFSGTLTIKCLNELRCPETASSSVSILAYCYGGDDFELQVPHDSPSYDYPFSPEAGDITIHKGTIGNSVVPSEDVRYRTEAVGDSFNSVKQLLAKFTTYWQSSVVSMDANKQLMIYPFGFSAVRQNHTTGALEKPIAGASAIDIFSFMYAYYRGDTKFKIVDRGNTSPPGGILFLGSILSSPLNYYNYTIINNGFNDTLLLGYGDYVALQKNVVQGVATTDAGVGFLSVKVPYYSKFKTGFVSALPPSTSIPLALPGSICSLIIRASAALLQEYTIFRGAADDFQFIYFIGCPPNIVNYT
jgi:hypothetical protein